MGLINRAWTRRVPLILAGGLLLLALHANGASEAPRVVVSIKPLHSLLAGLMQGVTEPRLLVDGTGTPWDYQADENDRTAIREADLLIWSGVELEPGVAALLVADGGPDDVFEVLASEEIKILPARHDDRLRDPFYWLDSRNMLTLLDRFARILVEHDPGHAASYERNWQRMAEELSVIDRRMEFAYRDVSGVPVFAYHDTQQYFEQSYAMRMVASVASLAGGEQLDTTRLLQTRAEMLRVGPSCLLTEKGLQEPHLQLLLTDAPVTTVELDSLGSALQPGPALYMTLMRDNFAAIAQCVRGLKPEEQVGQAFAAPDPSRSASRLTPRYMMMDQFGRAVSHEDFAGSLQLIYFGYTYCPDICPTSLAVMAQAMQLLGEEAAQIQPIFITVDPQRDTPELLAEYVQYFHPRMLGLSASPEITRRTAELFRVRYEYVPSQSGDEARYAMDHTASLYLIGRNGEFITKFAHGLPASEVAARLRGYLQE